MIFKKNLYAAKTGRSVSSRRSLVTGGGGFIGIHLVQQLLERGDTVVGLDNFNDYYDVNLKEARAAILDDYENFSMVRIDLADRDAMEALFAQEKFDKVIHLAAQAGVRYSIENPHSYIESNVVGTLHILEGCRHHDVEHLTYASSSSVYGANTTMPFSIHQNVDHPLALYGATKKAKRIGRGPGSGRLWTSLAMRSRSEARSPPKSANLLSDDHPASTREYTPNDAMAKM